MRSIFFVLVLFQILLGSVQAEDQVEYSSNSVLIPLEEHGRELSATLYLPLASDNPPLIILNHGASLGLLASGGYWWDQNPLIEAFLERGYAVLLPMRRGFGQTGGGLAEARYDCESPSPDFHKAGLEAASDIMAALAFAENLTEIDRNRIVLAGYHSGGFASVVAAGLQPPSVVAVAGFTSGRGNASQRRGMCFADELTEVIGRYSSNTLAPVLWIYLEDDRIVPQDIGREWYESFRDNGGMGSFKIVPAGDYRLGEELFGKQEADTWVSVFEQFLNDHGVDMAPLRQPD